MCIGSEGLGLAIGLELVLCDYTVLTVFLPKLPYFLFCNVGRSVIFRNILLMLLVWYGGADTKHDRWVFPAVLAL